LDNKVTDITDARL